MHTKEGEVEVLHMEPNGVLVGRHGEVLGRVHGHTITDADDRPLAWVGDDRRVAIAGEPPGAYLDPRGSLEFPGVEIVVTSARLSHTGNEDDHVVEIREDGRTSLAGELRGVGRRTWDSAAVIIGLLALHKLHTATALPPRASSSPAPPPAPAAR